MDHSSIPTGADYVALSEPHPGCLSPTDPEARGRRRRRDPIPVYTTLHRPQHNSLVESSTFRGRVRYRSPSGMGLISLSTSRAGSPPARHHHHQEAEDAKKRRLLGVMLLRPENHRRSQSPSRSRSPVLTKNQKKAQDMFSSSAAARRRQRTQSRSRTHGQAGLFETGVLMERSSLMLEMMTADGSARGQG